MDTTLKMCRTCLRALPPDQFYRKHARCKACYVQVQMNYNRSHREQATANTRAWSARNPEKVREYRARTARKNADKIKVRKFTQQKVRSGKIKKTPCEVCGSAAVQIHHPDYSNGMLARFLCQKHHSEIHRKHEALVLK